MFLYLNPPTVCGDSEEDSEDECILTGDIAAGCKLLRNRFESKDREWASYTCVLGFHVMGEK